MNDLKLFISLQIPDCAWARVKYGQLWWCEAVKLPRDKLSQWVSTPPYFVPFCLPSPLLYVCTILLRLLFGPNLLPLFCEFAKQKWCIAGSRWAGWSRTRNTFWSKLLTWKVLQRWKNGCNFFQIQNILSSKSMGTEKKSFFCQVLTKNSISSFPYKCTVSGIYY